MDTYDLGQLSNEAFAAYLGGFTDGEGYVGIEPTNRKNVSVVRIVLANCVPEVLRGIQARLGYGAIRSQKLKPHWRERFTLSVTNMADCERFLLLTLPYLFIKQDTARLALARINQAREKPLQIRERNNEIRALAAAGGVRRQIARRYGVSPQLISRICEGHKWPSEQSKIAKLRRRGPDGLFLPIAQPS